MADQLKLDRVAMKDRSTAHLRIYVGGLTESATVEELYEHFKLYGTIDGIVINRGFGFIQFEDESSAQKAINQASGSTFQGKNLSVRTALTDKARREPEVVTIQTEIPPAVALNDNLALGTDDNAEEYDTYGNYVGDQRGHFEEEEYFPPSRGRGGGGGGGGPHRGRGRGGRRREPVFRDRSPMDARGGGDWPERRYQPPMPEYPRALPVPERNDCEIIVVSKALTEYAEYIEDRLKRLGIVVDLLFPMEDVPIGKVLGNIASRGCLYAILVMPQNQEQRSLTLTILHGLPQEHRNMPIEDALQLLSRNFQEVQRGGPTGREAVYALLGQLADGRTLTVMQYDKVMEYLQEKRTKQVKIELGEPLQPTETGSKTQVDLQQRILSILNDKKVPVKEAPPPVPPPKPVEPPTEQNKLLNDPSVRKALDSILQKFV